MTARLIALAATIALAAPAGAIAQDPLAPLPPAPPSTTQAQTQAPSTGLDDGGLEGWQQALIFASGLILLAGIGYAIVSDARHRAPVVDRRDIAPEPETPRQRGTRPPPERKKERRRQTARRARAQRKRNR